MGGQNAANMWMFRIIPAFITGAFIVATYGLVAQICGAHSCSLYKQNKSNEKANAAAS